MSNETSTFPSNLKEACEVLFQSCQSESSPDVSRLALLYGVSDKELLDCFYQGVFEWRAHLDRLMNAIKRHWVKEPFLPENQFNLQELKLGLQFRRKPFWPSDPL